MASRSANYGDQLATWLNSPSRPWSATPLNVARTYDPVRELEDLDALKGDLVLPSEPEQEESVTRGMESQDYAYVLSIRKKYLLTGQIPNTWVDELVDLTERIASALRNVELTGVDSGFTVRVQSARVAPQWDPEMLWAMRTYGGGVEIILREYRPT